LAAPKAARDPIRRFAKLAMPASVIVFTIVFSTSLASALPEYQVQGLGIPTGASASAAAGINGSNQVAGYATVGVPYNGVLFSGGITVIPSLGGQTWAASGINQSGQMSGYGQIADGTYNALVYSGGTTTSLGSLSGSSGTPISYGFGIDSAGDIVGMSGTDSGAYHAFIYSAAGHQMNDLGTLGGGGSSALGISPAGAAVVGYSSMPDGSTYAFIYLTASNTMHDLGTLGGTNSYGTAVNDVAHVVGYSGTPSDADTDAFFYDGKTMHDLGDPNGFGSYAQAINSSDTIVGYFTTDQSSDTAAFIYLDGSLQNLNALISANSGWTLQDATGINDAGDIVGYGLDPAGNTEAFELTPISSSTLVPLPSAAWMSLAMLGGLAMLGVFRSRFRSSEHGAPVR